MRRSGAALAAVLALGGAGAMAAATGCGGDDGPTSATVVQGSTTAVAPSTGPDATVPTTTTAAPPSSAAPSSTTTDPTATTGVPTGGVQTTTAPDTGGASAGGEEGEGGGGDEEATRVPVALTADGGALSPTIVTIPAFLAIELRVENRGAAEKLTISTPGGGTLAVPAGRTTTRRLTGLKPGDYAVTTAGGGKTTLHVVNGGDPGP